MGYEWTNARGFTEIPTAVERSTASGCDALDVGGVGWAGRDCTIPPPSCAMNGDREQPGIKMYLE